MKRKPDWSTSFRGPVLLQRPNSTKLTFNVDDDLREWIGKRVDDNCGGFYTDLMNHALREYVENHPDGLDDEMRAVLRAPREVNPKYLAWMRRIERMRRAKAKPARARRARTTAKKRAR